MTDRSTMACQPVGCTIRVTDTGAVTVERDHGCTADDVRELCDALVRGELEIIDLTGWAGCWDNGGQSPARLPDERCRTRCATRRRQGD